MSSEPQIRVYDTQDAWGTVYEVYPLNKEIDLLGQSMSERNVSIQSKILENLTYYIHREDIQKLTVKLTQTDIDEYALEYTLSTFDSKHGQSSKTLLYDSAKLKNNETSFEELKENVHKLFSPDVVKSPTDSITWGVANAILYATVGATILDGKTIRFFYDDTELNDTYNVIKAVGEYAQSHADAWADGEQRIDSDILVERMLDDLKIYLTIE